jgi:hypothetical protein
MKNFWDGFEKRALIGPVVSAATFGIPELIGYQAGKLEGINTPKEHRKDTTSGIVGKAVKWSVIPGATGYYFGKLKGQKLQDRG